MASGSTPRSSAACIESRSARSIADSRTSSRNVEPLSTLCVEWVAKLHVAQPFRLPAAVLHVAQPFRAAGGRTAGLKARATTGRRYFATVVVSGFSRTGTARRVRPERARLPLKRLQAGAFVGGERIQERLLRQLESCSRVKEPAGGAGVYGAGAGAHVRLGGDAR